jgi:hypothetical protein
MTFKEIKHVQELWVNFFSIKNALKNGFDLSNKGLIIRLKRGSVSVTFDRVTKAFDRSIYGIKITRYDPSVAHLSKLSLTAINELM